MKLTTLLFGKNYHMSDGLGAIANKIKTTLPPHKSWPHALPGPHWALWAPLGPWAPVGPLGPIGPFGTHWALGPHWALWAPLGPLGPIGPLGSIGPFGPDKIILEGG